MQPRKPAAIAGIAQLVEHFTRNEGVVSSSLISGSFFYFSMYNNGCAFAQAGIAQSVEHFTRNEGVVSSSLISGSLRCENSALDEPDYSDIIIWCIGQGPVSNPKPEGG